MANELKFTGVLVKHLEPKTGTSANGEWIKRFFILQGPGQHDKPFPISVFGKRGDILAGVAEGEELTVWMNLEGREYNDKWYLDAGAWKIERANGQTTERQPSAPAYVPPVAQGRQPAPAGFTTTFDDESNDLPF